MENLRTAVAAWRTRPETEVVVETFDQALAYHLEHEGMGRFGTGRGNQRKVRRAFSQASLAAPFFVAQALRSENLLTTRFVDRQVTFFWTPVLGGAELAGKSVGKLERDYGCTVVARRQPERLGSSRPLPATILGPKDELVLGGLASLVVKAAYQNTPVTERAGVDVQARARGWGARLRRIGQGPVREFQRRPALTRFMLVFFVALALAVAGVAIASGGAYEGFVRLPTLWARTALGEEEFDELDETNSLKLIGLLALFFGTGLVAIFTGYLSSLATKEKVDSEAGARRQARTSLGHVVIAGLGELGYRIARLLTHARVDCVVVSPAGDDPYVGATETLAPVLTGSIRLEENFRRANIGAASALIACSDDHLSNVEACIRTRRFADEVGRPAVRTVASVSRDSWASEAALGFGIDKTLDAAHQAAPTFAQAATEPDVHRIAGHDLALDVARVRTAKALSADELVQLHADQIRVVARAHHPVSNRALPVVDEAKRVTRVEAGEELLVSGPRGKLKGFIADHSG